MKGIWNIPNESFSHINGYRTERTLKFVRHLKSVEHLDQSTGSINANRKSQITSMRSKLYKALNHSNLLCHDSCNFFKEIHVKILSILFNKSNLKKKNHKSLYPYFLANTYMKNMNQNKPVSWLKKQVNI